MPTVSAAPGSTGYSITFYATGPSVNPNTVYVAWIEDENGTNMQNLYVCNREANYVATSPDPYLNLTGRALPNWLEKKYPQHTDIDGITGPSTQQVICFSRDLDFDTDTRFRVCLEIDRSNNSNAYFSADRPAFTYKTGLIDLDGLSSQSDYPIILAGWMSNDTDGYYGQQPSPPIPGYAPYVFMEDTTYVYPYDDMVTAGQVVITAN
jgi:hypothetical protein